jgi:intermembrane space import and assembly protein 40
MPVANKLDENTYTYHVKPEEMTAPPSSDSSSSETPSKPQQAYDPETGVINWDCPCIASMVEPPCGDLFKTAFSCFVYSEVEPKGADCLEAFREMQTCFQENPEKYGDKENEEEDEEEESEKVDGEKEAVGEPVKADVEEPVLAENEDKKDDEIRKTE